MAFMPDTLETPPQRKYHRSKNAGEAWHDSRRLACEYTWEGAEMAAGLVAKGIAVSMAIFAAAGRAEAATPPGAALSVMTYNVEGLPWPLAWGRSSAFIKIEQRLMAMRQRQTQPHVIILQEAFSAEAKQIATLSGYRYVANGPSKDMASGWKPNKGDVKFASEARFLKGESYGKLVDSGLLIASDYPITSIRRAAFPDFACAGFDCLANKGMLLVTVAVPGSPNLVTIATTHMNSKKASGVSQERSLYAYERQVEALDRFIDANRNPELPIIFAGDFNASNDARRAYLVNHSTMNWTTRLRLPIENALHHCLLPRFPCGGAPPSIASTVFKKGRDFQFYTQGFRASLQAVGLAVPFGNEQSGGMLSDHVGYNVIYRLKRTTRERSEK
jgi:endonuclease/exonuclease/phosphatase family metal-dependent hydrolase